MYNTWLIGSVLATTIALFIVNNLDSPTIDFKYHLQKPVNYSPGYTLYNWNMVISLCTSRINELKLTLCKS